MSTGLNKSDLITRMAEQHPLTGEVMVEESVRVMLDQMVASLASGKRIEIRGFGSFTLRYRKPRMGRNPKTGESVELGSRHVPHFKPGKELRERVND